MKNKKTQVPTICLITKSTISNPSIQTIHSNYSSNKNYIQSTTNSSSSSMIKNNTKITQNQPSTSSHNQSHQLKPSSSSDNQSISSHNSSSWWSWFSVSPTQPTTTTHLNESIQSSLIQVTNSIDHSYPNPNILDPTTSQPPSYLSNIGTWAYSWITENSSSSQPPQSDSNETNLAPTQNLVDSLPNPIIKSIPLNTQGWANYFSSRRSLPIHKLNQISDHQSIESMSLELDSPKSAHSQTLPVTSTMQINPKSRPKSVIDFSKNWIGLGNSNTSSSSSSNQVKPIFTSSNSIPNIQTIHAINQSTSSSSTKDLSNSIQPQSLQTGQQSNSNITPLTDNLSPQTMNQIIKGKRVIPNLVLPSFEDTFHHPPRSFLPRHSKPKKTFELVQSLIYSNPPPPEFPQTVSSELKNPQSKKRRRVLEILENNRHISTTLPKSLNLLGIKKLERIKKVEKVAIIGIHGWFPGPWLESVLGKPTGTSHKFTTMMDKSLRRYIEKELQGKKLNEDFTRIINLEREGRVDDRVEYFFNELTNKRKDCLNFIKSADVVFIVSHSQGCLVGCKLVEKLLLSFNLNASKFLSLSMCGIWNGPYIGLNNNFALQPVLKLFEGPAAHELFEFQDHHSPASKALMKSFKNTLRLGMKYILIGSMNDQVVPIYSSINNSIDHPSILRAIFIDSAVFYSTDFLTNLIVFCLRLRNSGFSDHGLLYLLSDYLVGSLTGVGHSTIYEDQNVFELAARYFFETSTPLEPPTYDLTAKEIQTGASNNQKAKAEEETNEIDSSRSPSSSYNSLPDNLSNVDYSFNPRENSNPFLLTWSLRGLIEDHKIKMLFNHELIFLKDAFLRWNPGSTSSSATTSASTNSNDNKTQPLPSNSNSKILKDLKIKLEPFREVRLD